ncbi:hypothetical protein HO173_003578 [Letharia columbiana]|uniref:Protein kinase domain-containing protein n=1 Tax=Letharia columbiana TaxID=112416 RepID=A0A8H6G0S9_9LECA|nr:uncharacterized protein HO173_003578 [Letharia columbiana]KAF6238298.1 hypothetical protein HO173_003578 [Letharia columbiana]
MAHDLHAGFERLRTNSGNLSPTSPDDNTTRSRDNETHGTETWANQADAEKTGPLDKGRLSHPSSRASDTDLQWLARIQDVGHAITRPIDVPQASVGDGSERTTDKSWEPEPGSRYQEPSPFEEFMRDRRPSISFNPKVTLESGHEQPLEQPLPKLAIDTRARSRPILLELERYPVRSPLYRSHSEADCRNYDPGTGELLGSRSRRNQAQTTPRSPENRSRWPLLQSTAESLAQEQEQANIPERGASLTSESTLSPVASEVHTPTDNMDILISPLSSHGPFPFPVSYEDSSAWPKLRQQPSASRSKSYSIERRVSMRAAQRQGSRSSRRSTSSSMSPATAFLSRFAREEASPEPDSEGQEVGEYVIGKQVGFGGFSTVKEAYTLEGEERICRAVKVVRKQVAGKEELENELLQAEFEHEISLWRCLGHRNILPLIEVYVTDFATFCFTKLNTGGTLFDLVRANRHGISRDLARRYAYQLASAIRYLHEDVRVVHRDIKLENCLVDISDPDVARDGGNILLCDFGLAEFVTSDTRRKSPEPYERAMDRAPPKNIGPSETSTSIAGSLQYASPELIMSPAGFLSSVVDMWAYGVVIYALLVGDLPFQHMFQPRVQMMILAGEWDMTALETAVGVIGYEEEVLELMSGCLEMESERRWTIAQVLKSRWLDGCQEMLEDLKEDWKL